jgi:hypothetical protein
VQWVARSTPEQHTSPSHMRHGAKEYLAAMGSSPSRNESYPPRRRKLHLLVQPPLWLAPLVNRQPLRRARIKPMPKACTVRHARNSGRNAKSGVANRSSDASTLPGASIWLLPIGGILYSLGSRAINRTNTQGGKARHHVRGALRRVRRSYWSRILRDASGIASAFERAQR